MHVFELTCDSKAHASELDAQLAGVRAALKVQMGRAHINMAMQTLGNAAQALGAKNFSVFWNFEWKKDKPLVGVLSFGFNVPLEALPIVGRRVNRDLERVPELLKRELPWLSVRKIA